MGFGVPAYLTWRLDIHYILDEVDRALEPERIDRYQISSRRADICFWRLIVSLPDTLGL